MLNLQTYRAIFYPVVLALLSVLPIAAQEIRTEGRPVAVEAAPVFTTVGTGVGYMDDDEDDTKVTGATVRGKVVYEDTSRPVRYAMVMLSRGAADGYSAKYVKTDENGEFVFKNVKDGKYLPVVKGAGILNERDAVRMVATGDKEKEKADPREIAVSGLGEFNVMVRAKRGAAVTGRIFYADGEPAVGVKVQALQKRGDYFGAPLDSAAEMTDDRGVYRIAGLPEGIYIVRVIEPVSHGPNKPEYEFNFRDRQGSVFRTYYPEGDTSKTAKEIEMLLGSEQNGVDITIPDRARFAISGKIIRKRDSKPLEKFNVLFVNLSTAEMQVRDYGGMGTSIASNKLGEWTLRNLPKGKYRVTVSQGYILPNDENKNKVERYPSMTREIEITDKDISDVLFEIPTAASVSGTMIIEGGNGLGNYSRLLAVNAETGETRVAGEDYLREEGKKPVPGQQDFRFGDLKEGKYTLTIGDNDYFVKSVSGPSGVSGTAFEIKEGESIAGIRVVLSGGMGSVKGKVTNASADDTIVAVLVKPGTTAATMPANSKVTRVGPAGEFELKWAPGDYVLFVTSIASRPASQEEAKEWLNDLIRNGTRVTLKAGEVTTAAIAVSK